jgi:hypothetical protein
MKIPLNAVDLDPVRTDAWLRSPSGEHPGATNAEALGIDPEDFRRDTDGFLSTVDDLLVAGPRGLLLGVDVDRIELWLIPDGDVLDCGALISPPPRQPGDLPPAPGRRRLETRADRQHPLR